MFDPLTIGMGILGWQLLKKSSAPGFGMMTPEREEIFRNALEHLQDPKKLQDLAVAFEQQGLKPQGAVLRKRATWRSRDNAKRAEHEAIFQKALASKNIPAILEVARAFEAMTATVKSKQLVEYVEKLKAEQAAPVKAEEKAPEKPAEQPS
jgi:uncharacterized protein (UPF0335 family)